ncbi:MAG: hypothetical protein JSU58_05670 [Dehalococcoidales bacterium]|nr:MAG: hypothetical protein JSU58_05670 [Dehalococcoidales bacterium]
MKKYIVFLLAMVLLVSVAGCSATSAAGSEDPDNVIITLERTACFGFCPVYKITIHGDGTVIYEGKEFVETQGKAETTIDQEKIKQLISEFEEIDYFSLQDEYTERTITDASSAITSITIDGKTKTVEHYHGDFNAPEGLTELEDRIDEIVNSEQWIQ